MEHFIETVRKYPCLWNTTAIEYRDQELKDAAWTEVMKETDLSSVKEVKMKWKKLRDSYRDALKRQNDMLSKEPGNSVKKSYPWKYMKPMQFLQPHMSVRRKPAECAYAAERAAEAPPESVAEAGADAAANGAHSSDESESEAESCARRGAGGAGAGAGAGRLAGIDRKLEYLCEAQCKRRCTERARAQPAAPDPLDIFFNGMCQSTKRFPYLTQIKIKRMVFEAVVAAEEALVAEQQSYASLWARGGGSSGSSSAGAEPEPGSRSPPPAAEPAS